VSNVLNPAEIVQTATADRWDGVLSGHLMAVGIEEQVAAMHEIVELWRAGDYQAVFAALNEFHATFGVSE